MNYSQSIKAHATALKVPYLLHFTQAANLPDILAHGIYPIARAHEAGVEPLINDALRLDRCRDASSVSIGFPNEKMFFKYRQKNTSADWVVLVLHPALLWTKSCVFCCHNAASNDIRFQSLEQRSTPEAFRGLFQDEVGTISRRGQILKPYDPTDVQAEVLVRGIIEPQFILGAVFNSPAVRDKCLPPAVALRSRIVNANQGFFARRDYARACA